MGSRIVPRRDIELNMLHRIFLNMDYEILLDSIECYSYSFLNNQESSDIFDNLPSHNIIVLYLVDIAVLYFASDWKSAVSSNPSTALQFRRHVIVNPTSIWSRGTNSTHTHHSYCKKTCFPDPSIDYVAHSIHPHKSYSNQSCHGHAWCRR